MKNNIQLVIVDSQNNFCDLPDNYKPIINGKIFDSALPVKG